MLRGIDGYSRMIVYLKANTNNSAATVFQLFLGAVEKFGLPSRVRSDKGGENMDIARYMLSHPLRGPDRGSHITGRSVHNQRTERLWRDVCYGRTHTFYNLFSCIEDSGILDPSNEINLYALHYIFFQGLIADSPSLSMDMPEHQLVQNTVSPLNSFGSQA